MITNHNFMAWDGNGKCAVCGNDISEHDQIFPLVTNREFLSRSSKDDREAFVRIEKLRIIEDGDKNDN